MPFQKGNKHGAHKNHARGYECRNIEQLQNMRWVHKGDAAMRIPSFQLNQYLTEGWEPGRPSPSEESRSKMSVAQLARTDHPRISRTPPEIKKTQHRTKYKKSPEDFTAKLAEQSGHCAFCSSTGSVKRSLCWDHDHECCSGWKTCGLCMRGLLCIACNKLLGHLETLMKDGEFIPRAGTWSAKALDYLLRYKVELQRLKESRNGLS